MTPQTPTDAPQGPETALNWVSVSQAAAALGVSERTIQRRASAGQVPARKVSRRDGEAWEVGLGAAIVPTGAANGADSVLNLKEARALPTADTVPTVPPRGADSSREVELKEEVRFLRGQLEEANRGQAELRAALRKALEAMPRALPSPNAGATPKPAEAPGRAENGGVDTPKRANGPQIEPQRKETGALTYGDVLAELERDLGAQNDG